MKICPGLPVLQCPHVFVSQTLKHGDTGHQANKTREHKTQTEGEGKQNLQTGGTNKTHKQGGRTKLINKVCDGQTDGQTKVHIEVVPT